MIPSKNTISSSIIDRMSQLSFKEGVSDFDVRLFKSEAKKILNINPVQYWIITGAIACLEKNVPDMHHAHKNAIKLSNGSSLALSNYSSSLLRIGDLGSACAYAMDAQKNDPADMRWLHYAIFDTNFFGRFKETQKLIETWDVAHKHSSHELKARVDKSVAFMDKHSIDESHLSEIISVISGILNTEIPFGWTPTTFDNSDESLFPTVFEFEIFKENADIAGLFTQIEDALTECTVPSRVRSLFVYELYSKEMSTFLDLVDDEIDKNTESISAPTSEETALIKHLIRNVKAD